MGNVMSSSKFINAVVCIVDFFVVLFGNWDLKFYSSVAGLGKYFATARARARLHGTERNRNPGLIYSYRKIEFPLHLKHFVLIFEEILTAISSFSSRHVGVEVSRKKMTTFLLIANDEFDR